MAAVDAKPDDAAPDRDYAIAALHLAEYGDLVRLASLMLGDVHAAEEVVQDGFLRVYAAWDRIREPGRLQPSVACRAPAVSPHVSRVIRFLRGQITRETSIQIVGDRAFGRRTPLPTGISGRKPGHAAFDRGRREPYPCRSR